MLSKIKSNILLVSAFVLITVDFIVRQQAAEVFMGQAGPVAWAQKWLLVDSLDGVWAWVLAFELALAAVVVFRAGQKHLSKAIIFTACWIILLSFNQFLSLGHPIAAVGFGMPGSFVNRGSFIADPFLLARLCSPFSLIILLSLAYLVRSTSRNYLYSPLIRFLLLIAFEGLLQELTFTGLVREQGSYPFLCYIHVLLTQLCISSLVGFGVSIRSEISAKVGNSFSLVVFVGMAVCALLFASTAKTLSPHVAAYYYSWFPENFSHGFVGKKLIPPQLPKLGEYRAEDPNVLSQHIDWAKEAGINVFIFDWWAQRPWLRKRIFQHLKNGEPLDGFRFSMHYETFDIKERGDEKHPHELQEVIYLTPERRYRLKKHWEHIAKSYMKHPSYLRIDGRAVLFVYATRHVIGPVAEAIREAKRHVKETVGVDLFVVGDEVFFHVIGHNELVGARLNDDFKPHWSRLVGFDAITSYNPYDSTRTEHGGESGAGRFISDVGELYDFYSGIASKAAIPFIPTALPGYNDRGVRPKVDHYVIPRKFAGKSFFAESLKSLIAPYFPQKYPIFTVTSWNEWNEGTQIEPVSPAEPTNRDISASGSLFTQNENFSGYDMQHLQELKEFLDN